MIGQFTVPRKEGPITVTLNDSGVWECEADEILAGRLNLTDPYPDELHPSFDYDPNPEATAIIRAARRYGGTVTVKPEVERVPGRLY